jgi:class 3 adenylate cyclase
MRKVTLFVRVRVGLHTTEVQAGDHFKWEKRPWR